MRIVCKGQGLCGVSDKGQGYLQCWEIHFIPWSLPDSLGHFIKEEHSQYKLKASLTLIQSVTVLKSWKDKIFLHFKAIVLLLKYSILTITLMRNMIFQTPFIALLHNSNKFEKSVWFFFFPNVFYIISHFSISNILCQRLCANWLYI